MNASYQVLFDISFPVKAEAAHVNFFVRVNSINSYFHFIHQRFAHCKERNINKVFIACCIKENMELIGCCDKHCQEIASTVETEVITDGL